MRNKDKAAISLFKKLRASKSGTGCVDAVPLRVALARDVDLSKADPKCDRCKGTGVAGQEQAPDGSQIDRICRCVSANGGIRPLAIMSKLAEN